MIAYFLLIANALLLLNEIRPNDLGRIAGSGKAKV
jgi:hypothetical protein